MKIITWNVNGLRAVVKKDFYQFLSVEKPDILCVQEIKMGAEAIEKEAFIFPDYEVFYHPAERPGYSGTAMFVKISVLKSLPLLSQETYPTSSRRGVGVRYVSLDDVGISDSEGRVQILEVADFFLVNTYFPNANSELSRLDFKLNFNKTLFATLKKMEKKKPVIICGDFNVAHEEIDLARPKANVGSAGFTKEEREAMTSFLASGFVDVFRELYPESQEYTWWSYRSGARPKNIGWRIDYFCVSKKLMPKIADTKILSKVMDSDHCPVLLEIQ